MVQVWTEPLGRRHFCGWFGEGLWFRIILFLSAIVVSIVVSYATGGFWVKIKPAADQATVLYTGDALLLFEGQTAGDEYVWSTSSVINDEFASYFIPATVQAGEEDYNFDGKPDIITFIASVQGEVPIYGVKALLQFKYNLDSKIKLAMYSLAYVAHSSPSPGGALYIDGQLSLQQQSLLVDRAYNGLYDSPMLNSTAPTVQQAVQASTSLEFQSIIKSYLDRNYTTSFTHTYPVWKAGAGNGFEVHIRVRIPPAQIFYYRPQLIENLKHGWIQFLATYAVIWWLFWWFQHFIFTYRLVDTRIISDIQPQMQKF